MFYNYAYRVILRNFMAKKKTKWVCQNCGYESPAYLGKCPECSSWGTLIEETDETASASSIKKQNKVTTSKSEPTLLNDITADKSERFSSGYEEFDRVLGGGFVKGSLILTAGEPGIGKSTLILQSCGYLSSKGKKILYVSAEESEKQLKIRAERLNIHADNLFILSETCLENIFETVKDLKPDFLVIDSIQAIYSQEITSSSGSVSQVRECCYSLMNLAKYMNITTVIIGHVTKDGTIAGPKILEHMVDAVICFEGDRYREYRILRSTKNRFGSTNEVGLFNMGEHGLKEVKNPGEIFIAERSEDTAPGSIIVVANEGNRPLLVEIQALVSQTFYPAPRRVSTGIEYNRVLKIIAVLEKRIGLNLSKHDIYVNVVGGIDIDDSAADLGVALAIMTSFRDISIDHKTAVFGEIGLTGEIRSCTQAEIRIKEAYKLGFEKIIIPKGNAPSNLNLKNLKIVCVSRLIEAVSSALQQEKP